MKWQNLPPWTSQYSIQNRVDALDCVSESLGNIIYMMTGFDSSPRALAKLSGTTKNGNSEGRVMTAANTFGLIPYEMWPTPDYFDWDSYYNPIPQDVLNSAIRCKISIRPFDLTKSPGWTVLQFPNGALHAVCQINEKEYFDSEVGSPVKKLTYGGAEVINRVSLTIQLMISAKIVRFADNKTFGIMVDSPNGTQIIKATSEEQFRSWNKPDSYGKPTVNPDGTTNWSAELQLNF